MDWQQVTPSTLVSFLGVAHEKTTLDLKATYDRALPARYEQAKDLAAFANVLGGTLVVGAIEGKGPDKGRPIAFKSVPDVPYLTDELTEAVRLCFPPPVVLHHRITLTAAEQATLLDRPVSEDASLLIVNVQASLVSPIGCLGCDANGKKIDDHYRFPIRTVEGTRYLRPEELPFHMNSHERRTLLQLRQVPGDTMIFVWGRKLDGSVTPERCTLVSLDPERLVMRINRRDGRFPEAEVPLAMVRTVWKGEETWEIAIEGTVFKPHASKNQVYGFMPLGGCRYD